MSHSLTEPSNAPGVPDHTLLEKLSQGGMGEVFLARHEPTGELRAIKFLTPLQGPSGEEQRRRLERETRLMAHLRHPNIVQVLDQGVAAERPYLVLEYVAGGSLRGWMTPGRPTPLPQVRQVLAGVVPALVLLAESQIIHRDLKPENILVDASGEAKITDFGISAAEPDVGQLTHTGQVLGTLDYMAPEQRTRLPVDARADQFSLAVIVYELLTGKRPVGSFKPASRLNPRLSSRVDVVLAKALQEDPDDRYPSVRSFAEALGQALAGRSRRPRRRTALALAALALAAVAAVGLVVYLGRAADGPGGPTTVATDADVRPSAAQAPETTAEKVARLVKLADEHLAQGRGKEAIAAYSEAIGLAPPDPTLLLKRAHVYKRAKMHKPALADLQEALRLDPNLAEARLRRGEVYVQMGDYDLALRELEQAIRLDARLALAYAYRGWTHRRLGQNDLARRDLDTALALDKDCGIAYHYRGLICSGSGEYEQALADYRQSVRCTPDNPFAHSALASLLATCKNTRLRDGPLAVRHAQRACELTGWKEWRELRALAAACAQAGDLAAAIQWCQKAMELAPAEHRKGLRDLLTGYRKRLAAAQTGGTQR